MKGETSVKQRRGKGVTSEKRKITSHEGEGIRSEQATEVKKSATKARDASVASHQRRVGTKARNQVGYSTHKTTSQTKQIQ